MTGTEPTSPLYPRQRRGLVRRPQGALTATLTQLPSDPVVAQWRVRRVGRRESALLLLSTNHHVAAVAPGVPASVTSP